MKVKWLIENFTGDNGYEDLIVEVRNQGMECIVLDIRNHFTLREGLIEPNECVVFQGSIQLFKKLRSELFAYPLGWMSDDNYLCSRYYPHFQKFLFNDLHVFTSVAGLKHNKWWFYAHLGKEALLHIRPDSGDKLFSGQLIDLQDFDRFFSADDVRCSAKDTDFVVVSTPKNIRGEWRFICTNKGEIVAVSTYMYHGKRTYIPSAPTRATELCQEILKVGWYPDPIFTVDICEDNDGNFWMMEFNSFTSAGTYGANKKSIVEKVSQIALEEHTKKFKNHGEYL